MAYLKYINNYTVLVGGLSGFIICKYIKVLFTLIGFFALVWVSAKRWGGGAH